MQSHLAKKQVPPTLFQVKELLNTFMNALFFSLLFLWLNQPQQCVSLQLCTVFTYIAKFCAFLGQSLLSFYFFESDQRIQRSALPQLDRIQSVNRSTFGHMFTGLQPLLFTQNCYASVA